MRSIDKEFDEFKAKVLSLIPEPQSESDIVNEKNKTIASLIDEIYIDIAYANTGYCSSYRGNCVACKEQAMKILEEQDRLYLLDENNEVRCRIAQIFTYYEPKRKQKYIECGIECLYDIQEAFLIYDDLNGNR